MSMLCLMLLAVSLSVHSATSQVQNCDDVNEIFPNVFSLQDGSGLSKCAFNGQQCCDDILISFVDQGFRALVKNDAFNFTSGLAGAQAAIDEMRNKTNEIVDDVKKDVLRPLLLSAVPSPPSSFRVVVESVITDINTVLNGRRVDLKASIAKYFRAVALYYFDELIDSFPLLTAFIRLSDSQKRCGSQVLFNHIYSSTESAAKLVDLLQNISVAVGVIKQLPPIFDNLLQDILRFRFSDTCLDVFTSNYLCPVCRNQPFMCPGRCAEIVTGCVSPLHQSIVQLDTSTRLILSIIKSLIGASDSVTDAVTISRISGFYDDLVQTLKSLDFLDLGFILRVFRECRISIGFPFGKRSISEMSPHSVANKRALEIPDVGIDETFLKTLEKQFSSLGGDKLADATKRFCSPDFSVEFFGLQFQVTEANGRCSYGVCNVGHYNETYKKQDVVDQCFNPAGQFNYDQLINQAKNQTYVLTKLFSTTEIPKSVFSVFLPGETLPTTKFLEAPAPVKPTVNTNTTCEVPTSSTTTATSTATPTKTPCDSCPLSISGKYNSRRKRAVVTFSSSNPDATFKCELTSDKRARPCKSPRRWRNLGQGNHTATIYSICAMNNVVTTCSKDFQFQVQN